jgi:hypothetical protein
MLVEERKARCERLTGVGWGRGRGRGLSVGCCSVRETGSAEEEAAGNWRAGELVAAGGRVGGFERRSFACCSLHLALSRRGWRLPGISVCVGCGRGREHEPTTGVGRGSWAGAHDGR